MWAIGHSCSGLYEHVVCLLFGLTIYYDWSMVLPQVLILVLALLLVLELVLELVLALLVPVVLQQVYTKPKTYHIVYVISSKVF